MLVLDRVTVEFGGSGQSSVKALRGISLTIGESDYVTIIGPNGAGKSTLVGVLAGAIRPTSGRVVLDGKDISAVPECERARWIARVFSDPMQGVCDGLTLTENMSLAATRARHRSVFRPAVRRRRVTEFRKILERYGRGLENRLGQDGGKLSSGQRQLVALSMALIAEPELLLLDEHTSALDPEMAEIVMRATDELVRQRRVMSIMVTHNMSYARRFGDRLLIMDQGLIAEEIPRDEKRALDDDGLIRRFKAVAAAGITDRMLGG
jgi:putative ABC transport system ATP-binding protein